MDRVLTIPNGISAARLAGVPVFLWLVLGPRTAVADDWAVGLLIAAGLSDWLDGKIARALNQTSRLGQILDPAADRLYIAATIVALAVRAIIPWWLVAILAVRELTVGTRAGRPAAPGRLRHPAGQPGRQGRYVVPALRLPAAVPRRSPRLGSDAGPGHRLGLRDLGDDAVLVGRDAVPRPGQRPDQPAEDQSVSGGAKPLKAVVMAGGEGTRLRPMTANQPKPMLPVVNRPIMEHVLRLLKRHGFDETIVTVQFLAALVRNYFGDGEEFGMSLQYATEEMPLGTAGSVRNAEDALHDEPFLVISGDALTDMDLTELVSYHKEKGALVTVGLARIPDPLEFGIVITQEDGRIQRFLEKPTWGQVFSDTVNTGVYVMEPEVLAEVPPGEMVDWSGDVFPKLLKRGAPLYGYISDGYWEDVGTHESYLKAQADVLDRRVRTDIAGFEVSPGVWVAEGAEVDADAVLTGPLCIGDYAKIEAGRALARVHRDRQQRRGQGGRVPAPRGGAQQRLRRPGR